MTEKQLQRQRADEAQLAIYIANLRTLAATIPAETWAAAPRWYPSARDDGAAVLPSDPVRGCALISTLSPGTSYAQHVAGAIRMVAAAAAGDPEPVVSGYPANRAKAWRIANGAPIAEVLRGIKVTSFLTNIDDSWAGPVSEEPVTIDRWAVRACRGLAPADWSPKDAPRGKGDYALMAQAHRIVAAEYGIRPRDFQAAVWIHIRGRAD